MEAIEKLIEKFGVIFVLNLIQSGAIREYMNTRINADMKSDVDSIVHPEIFEEARKRKKEIRISEIKISFTR